MSPRRSALYFTSILLTALASDPIPGQESEVSSVAPVGEDRPAILPALDDRTDFELARRGFIAALPEDTVIRADDGRSVWSVGAWSFLDRDEAPATVDPLLWRQSRLNAIHGLFEVTARIYQVRGYDLSNVTFVEGESGWIVIDPLTTAETARAALALANEHLGERPVRAVIYTHSHVDHWGGVRGVVSEEDVADGRVPILAPEGFLEHAVSENVLAGNVMTRRASYMYGGLLPTGPEGKVGSGLGQAVTGLTGSVGLLAPTDVITRTGERRTLDGVEIVFQNTPGAEAPAEMMFLFPQLRALCLAENATATMHNLYTPRGAQVRDALGWSNYLQETLDGFTGGIDVAFASHHWPRWGKETIVDYLEKQRDLYKYLHDQTLRLANQGYTMTEIAERLELPPSLAREFHTRGYYGTVSHNAKAVYQRYLGWFDGNPANLEPLPPEETSRRMVELMGGAAAVLEKAKVSLERGELRWVAQLVNHVVFADPANREARELQAAALEQLGYRSESGPWRNFYLTGAQELRHGIPALPSPMLANPDVIRAMPLGRFFDALATRLDAERAVDHSIAVEFIFTDVEEEHVVWVENAVLHHAPGPRELELDATVTLTRHLFEQVALGRANFIEKIAAGEIRVDGKAPALAQLFGLLDTFEFWFPIVTP